MIWANFIANELLFETNHLVKRKYLDERPKVYEIGNKCPGRVGAWVGWQIVKAYLARNSEMSLQDFMKISDAKKIFRESNYKPQRPGLFN